MNNEGKLDLKQMSWLDSFTIRETQEIGFAQVYTDQFTHGTDGHNRLLLIAKLADMLDQAWEALHPKME